MSTPVRALRELIAASLEPLGAPVYSTLPDESYEPPYFAVGQVGIDQSQRAAGLLVALTAEVTLIGDRADSAQAQTHIDDLQWDAWQALGQAVGNWTVSAIPRPVNVAGLDYPAIVFSVESLTPC